MELACIMLSKISQPQKDKYDFTHTWNLRNKTDEHMGRGEKGEMEVNRRRLTTENKLTVDGGRWVGDGLVEC